MTGQVLLAVPYVDFNDGAATDVVLGITNIISSFARLVEKLGMRGDFAYNPCNGRCVQLPTSEEALRPLAQDVSWALSLCAEPGDIALPPPIYWSPAPPMAVPRPKASIVRVPPPAAKSVPTRRPSILRPAIPPVPMPRAAATVMFPSRWGWLEQNGERYRIWITASGPIFIDDATTPAPPMPSQDTSPTRTQNASRTPSRSPSGRGGRPWLTLPKMKNHVQKFMGFTGYYRRFIKDYAKRATPLTLILRNVVSIEDWSEKQTMAFHDLKDALTTAPVLMCLDFTGSFYFKTDTSNVAISAIFI